MNCIVSLVKRLSFKVVRSDCALRMTPIISKRTLYYLVKALIKQFFSLTLSLLDTELTLDFFFFNLWGITKEKDTENK